MVRTNFRYLFTQSPGFIGWQVALGNAFRAFEKPSAGEPMVHSRSTACGTTIELALELFASGLNEELTFGVIIPDARVVDRAVEIQRNQRVLDAAITQAVTLPPKLFSQHRDHAGRAPLPAAPADLVNTSGQDGRERNARGVGY